MNKQDFLNLTFQQLQELKTNPVFKNNLSQVRAKAIQKEFVPEESTAQFTFDAKQIWKSCDYLFSESVLLLSEDFEDKSALFKNIKTAAEAFESLAKFSEDKDREFLLLNAAFCYYIAGYQANGLCITKLIDVQSLDRWNTDSREDEGEEIDIELVSFFRKSLISFLRREITELRQISASALDRIKESQNLINLQERNTDFPLSNVFSLAAHAFFYHSLGDFAEYCANGNLDSLDSCKRKIEKSKSNFIKAGDSTLSVIVSELAASLYLFHDRSTWNNISAHANNLLEDPIWQYYLRNLALDKSIVEFWSSQLKAIKSDLLTSTDSRVVQMPTSAGKTFIAELAILAALTTNPESRCLYIAPYRALVNEIQTHLANVLGTVGFQVSTLVGGFEFDTFQNFLLTQAHVLVTTPEKVELLLRTNPEYFESLATIIVDEGHMIDEGVPSSEELFEGKTILEELQEQGTLGRGVLLELLITRLKIKLPESRFIFLSAVMPEVNAEDFVSWLCRQQQEPLRIEPSQRPSRQVIAKFEWVSAANGTIRYLNLDELPSGEQPWVPYFIQRKSFLTGRQTPTGRPQRKLWPNIDNKSQTTALLAAKLAKNGPVLVFCAQTKDARFVLNNLVKALKYLEASEEISNDIFRYQEQPTSASYNESLEWLGEDHPLTVALHHGVGLHYGPLPDAVRQAIEEDFKENRLGILVSTNTLGQGVNLPVKTVIIHSLERRWTESTDSGERIRTSKLRKRDFWNICGRAGRAGKETEGQVIFVEIKPRDRVLIQEYQNQQNLEEVDSALFKLLKALVEDRISQEDLIGYLDSHVLALLVEEAVNTQDESEISSFLENSLAGIQTERRGIDKTPLASTIKTVSTWIVDEVENEALRKVFATTGLSVASCRIIEESITQVLDQLGLELQSVEDEPIRNSEVLIQAAFSACQNLPELKLLHTIEYCGPAAEFSLIKNWIHGESIRALRSNFWNPNEGESFSRYLSDRLTYKLPWGVNGFLGILAFKLQRQYNDLPIPWQHLPTMMKFGVDNVFACWASSLGITSRGSALELARIYSSEQHPSQNLDYSDFVRWMVNMPSEYIINDLDISTTEHKKLLRVRNEIVIGDESLRLLRGEIQEFESLVRGISYLEAQVINVVARVRAGDRLLLRAEMENLYDPNAVSVLFEGQKIGYVQREKAMLVSKGLVFDKQVTAYVTRVEPRSQNSPHPSIEMRIRIE